jgi:predicted ATPase
MRSSVIDPRQSILSQRKDPEQYPEISDIGASYEAIRIHRAWSFARNAPPRRPAPADLPTAHLDEDAQNLGLILNRFRRDVPTKKALLEGLQQVFEGVRDFSVQVEGGTVQIFLEEERWTIPATRLSDGTLRWLALLAVLLDPSPPPLVCIEEPELGLHPDLMPTLARLLTDASERMQLVVTTHSEALVDAFTSTPEVVLVCERRAGSTEMRRLDAGGLAEWLKTYALGELWSKGELGGTRW